ncbi:MAG: SDR family NAD(P)-dependent oxidoreductase [Clostridia bacterium]|nr:SDR family NAD(P)-dependent oxidoreductase [Clostridia bacterium]
MKNILITGVCGGMGKATAEFLENNGYNVFGLDITECENKKIKFLKTDLTDENSIKIAFEKIKEQTSSIDAIIHFAGIYRLNSLVEMSEQEFVKTFDINLFSMFRINKIFLPLLKNGSKIILTSSELAPLDPLPFTGIYAITKSAIEKYAYSLKMELQLLNIDVCVIRPGAVKTTLLADSQSQIDNFCKNTKLYKYNSQKFKSITEKVETKNISPEKIAKLTFKILNKKHPKFIYNINRNFGLRLLNFLPKKLQLKIIKSILKEKKAN